VQHVVAERQVGGQLEGGLADEPAVHGDRVDPAVQLHHVLSPAALLQLDPHRHRVAVVHVNRDRSRLAAGDHHRRWKHPPPGPLAQLHQRGRRVGHVHAHRGQHRGHRLLRDLDVPTTPVVVVGGHAVGAGELGKLG